MLFLLVHTQMILFDLNGACIGYSVRLCIVNDKASSDAEENKQTFLESRVFFFIRRVQI